MATCPLRNAGRVHPRAPGEATHKLDPLGGDRDRVRQRCGRAHPPSWKCAPIMARNSWPVLYTLPCREGSTEESKTTDAPAFPGLRLSGGSDHRRSPEAAVFDPDHERSSCTTATRATWTRENLRHRQSHLGRNIPDWLTFMYASAKIGGHGHGEPQVPRAGTTC